MFLILFSSKILTYRVSAFNKICILEEEVGDLEEKSEEEGETIEGQEEVSKMSKSASEDEVSLNAGTRFHHASLRVLESVHDTFRQTDREGRRLL